MGALTQVLVVDDDPIVRDVLGRYLAQEGYAACAIASTARG
jgi:CheY-like chemotaxis protein